MAMTRRDFINGCFGLGVVAVVGRQAARAETVREQWYLFGTLVDVTLPGIDRESARLPLSQLSAELQKCNRDWHPWAPGRMYDINRSIAQGRSIEIDRHMVRMIEETKHLYLASDGTFNPTIGKVIARWGFHGGIREGWQVPDMDAISEIVEAAPNPLDLRVEGRQLHSVNEQVQLDLGGYAKGYAIDLGRRLLAENGVSDALINAGGDLVTLGHAPDGGSWRVAIRHPQRAGRLARLDVAGGEAVFTSGNYERYREHAGRRYPHIIDPRNGRPVHGVASATVVHTNPALADAAATALVVAGPRGWQRVAEAMGVQSAMVVDSQGKAVMTPDMQARVRLNS